MKDRTAHRDEVRVPVCIDRQAAGKHGRRSGKVGGMKFDFHELKEYVAQGGIQTGPFGSQLKAEEYSSVGVPVVMPKDMAGGRIVTTTVARVHEAIAVRLKRHRCEPGDILFARRGEIGRLALVQPTEKGWLCGTGCLRIRPNAYVVPEILAVALQSKVSVDWLTQNAVGQTMLNLNTEILASLPIALPPFREQRKIADILTTWDEALEKLDAMIQAKERRKKALMQQLLTGKKRLPNSTKKVQFLKASEVFTNRSERNTGGLPVLSVTQNQGVVLRSSLDRRIAHYEGNIHTYKVVQTGDYVVSLRSFQGGLEYSPVSGAVSPAYHVIHPIIAIDRSFYRHYFKSTDFVGRLATAVIGIRDGKQVNFTDFGFLRLPYPQIQDQERIGAILDACDEKLQLLRTQRTAIDRQKRGLMQRLLTGKLRVQIEQEARHA